MHCGALHRRRELSSCPGVQVEWASGLFDKMDEDSSGIIDKQESLKIHGPEVLLPPHTLIPFWRALRERIRKLKTSLRMWQAGKIFAKIDRDGSGQIEREVGTCANPDPRPRVSR